MENNKLLQLMLEDGNYVQPDQAPGNFWDQMLMSNVDAVNTRAAANSPVQVPSTPTLKMSTRKAIRSVDAAPANPLLDEYSALINQGISQREQELGPQQELLKQMAMTGNQGSNIDLSPLLRLADTWYGGNMSQGYKAPDGGAARMQQMQALQKGIQEGRQGITEDQINLLKAKMGEKTRLEDLAMKKEELGIKKQLANMKFGAAPALSKTEQLFENKLVQPIIDWELGGRDTAQGALEQLSSAKDLIDEYSSYFGKVAQYVPKQKLDEMRQNVVEPALKNIKAILGPQFTAKESEMIQDLAFDRSLSPEANKEKIDKAMNRISTMFGQMNNLSQEFKTTRSLKNWGRNESGQGTAPKTKPTKEQALAALKARGKG